MKKESKDNKKEDVMKYGEEIPTNFGWISLDKQKEIANKLVNLGKKKEK